MAKVKQPLLSFDARRKLGDDIVFKRQGRTAIVETRPIPTDARSAGQLSWRHMFLKVVALWHALSATEKEAWESLARPRHMTGYAWFVSQALRPNPGIYLPLQGGVMQGIIDMDGYAIQDLLDPVNPQDADTEAARNAAIADALEDCIDSHIHGFDGTNWQKLRVESAGQHNLRVGIYQGADQVVVEAVDAAITTQKVLTTKSGIYGKFVANDFEAIRCHTTATDGLGTSRQSLVTAGYLYGFDGSNWDRLRVDAAFRLLTNAMLYDGANGIDSELLSSVLVADTQRGLVVNAALRLANITGFDWREWKNALSTHDGDDGKYIATVALLGWSGTRWDRLRTYGTGILKVGRAEIGLSTLRRVGTGAVKASPGTLYWMTMNPGAANSVIELTDDLDGSTAVVWDMTHGVNAAHHMNLDPPMEFNTGIWLKTLTNFTSVIFGYK